MKNPEYNKVIEYIKDQIIHCQWQPGQRLPAERELSVLLGVGRYSVREAFRALESRGLLVSKAGSGSYLTADPCKCMPDVLNFLLISRQVTPGNISEIRRALEQEACRQTLIRATEKDLAQLSHIVDALSAAKSEESVQLDYAFHEAVFQCSRNPLMKQIMDALSLVCREQIDTIWRKAEAEDREALIKIHQKILDRLLFHDADGCRKAVNFHYDKIDCFL